jgi:drug/metabolite transporter (DMT)-like permease
VLLGVFCTALAHALFIRGLEGIRAQVASLLAALEPVYGIVFALVFLGEVPAWRTVAGGAVILAAVMAAGQRNRDAHAPSRSATVS